MQTPTSVTLIPPTVSLHTAALLSEKAVRKVCGYARVSTDNEEQLGSYEAQMDYYGKFIREHEGWEFAGLYSDEGITGTSIHKRKGFQKMIANALDGKIDLIVTKSISRFARNTVDSISTIRRLKAKGVEVYFEKDGLWTFDQSAELTISILSSIAQEESRNLSQNVTWGQRARFASGKVTMPFKHFLGYDRGEDGSPVVNDEQAEIVRRIYRLFVDGKTVSAIAKALTGEGIPTPAGRRVWQPGVVESILSNEKYKGDALLQKSYCTDYLTKKMCKNRGEVPQYYVQGSHPPIVGAELFDHVQEEMKNRKERGNIPSTNCFAGRIVCGDCGSIYGSKVWHSTSKYRRIIWQCNGKFKGDEKCATPHLYEKDLQRIFLDFVNSLITDRAAITGGLKEALTAITDNTALERERAVLQEECEVVMELIRKMVQENARIVQDQVDYKAREKSMAERYEKTSKRLAEVNKDIAARNAKQSELEGFMEVLDGRDELLTEFDESLWLGIVDKLKVHPGNEFTFVLKDGSNFAWNMNCNRMPIKLYTPIT